MEYCYLSTNQLNLAKEILKKEGFNDNQAKIMFDSFKKYNEADANLIINTVPSYRRLIEKLDRIKKDEIKYTAETLPGLLKSTPAKVKDFHSYLKRAHISQAQAISLNKYSECGYSDILNQKRNPKDYDGYFKKSFENLFIDLKDLTPKIEEDALDRIEFFLKHLDYLSNHNEYRVCNFLNNNNLSPEAFNRVSKFIKEVRKYFQLKEIIGNMDQALKNSISSNTVLYRGVLKKYIDDNLFNSNTESSINMLHEEGYLSTSYILNRSNADSPTCVALKLFVPKGSEGMDIIPLSENKNECEVLLNSCDMFFLDTSYETYSVHDDYSGVFSYTKVENKLVYNFLVLSKNRECYKYLADTEKNKEDNDENLIKEENV